MARLNIRTTQPATATMSPLLTSSVTDTVTHEGAPAYSHDDKSALFLLGSGRFFGEDSFYESAAESTRRYVDLVRRVAVADPAWFQGFVRWLRHDANIRTAAIVAAAEGAVAWRRAFSDERGVHAADAPRVSTLVSSVLVRADEVGEFLAYWRKNVRKSVPAGVQRALAARITGMDEPGAIALYTQRNMIKWDGSNNAYRFADAIELTHPKPIVSDQADLFKYLLDERHHKDGNLSGLFMLQLYKQFQERLRTNRDEFIEMAASDPTILRKAGMTWENLSSSGPMNAKAWEAIIPTMGYMALLRNLRNFDQAGVSDQAKGFVTCKLADPAEVAASRQLPFRFMSAYENAHGAAWQPALEHALTACVGNLPELSGKTVVMVDTSGSMESKVSGRSNMSYVEAAALFGVALAAKQESAELWGFADGTRMFLHKVNKGDAILRQVSKFCGRIGTDGHGTNVTAAMNHAMRRNATRIVVISDMQCMFGRQDWSSTGYYPMSVPVTGDVPVYAFNMVGYGQTVIESSSTQHQLGGLSDATFGLIKNIEDGQRGNWPWIK